MARTQLVLFYPRAEKTYPKGATMKLLLIAFTYLISVSQVSASVCGPIRGFSCVGLDRNSNTISYEVPFLEMMKVMGGKTGLTRDPNQNIGEFPTCDIPTGRGSAKIKLYPQDEMRSYAVSAKIKTSRGTVNVWCSEVAF